MKTLKESLLDDIETTLRNGDDFVMCNRLFSNNKKQMNDAIIGLMNKIKNTKTNKVDVDSIAYKLKHSKNYIAKISVVNGKYNLSICKFMYAGIWTIVNIFSSSVVNNVTMYTRASWDDVLQQLSTVHDDTIIYELVSDELNDLFDTICDNAKDYIRD